MCVQNILNGKWSIPSAAAASVSSECKELLRGMLTLDPTERITLSQIKKHPWYSNDLPEGVLQYRFLERPHDGLIEVHTHLPTTHVAAADPFSSPVLWCSESGGSQRVLGVCSVVQGISIE